MTLAERFVTDRDEVYRLIAAASYSDALAKARAIEFYLASQPDMERDGHSQQWRSEMVNVIARLERLVHAAKGIQANKIEYQRPTLTTRE